MEWKKKKKYFCVYLRKDSKFRMKLNYVYFSVACVKIFEERNKDKHDQMLHHPYFKVRSKEKPTSHLDEK